MALKDSLIDIGRFFTDDFDAGKAASKAGGGQFALLMEQIPFGDENQLAALR
jgi:hypothetical protein